MARAHGIMEYFLAGRWFAVFLLVMTAAFAFFAPLASVVRAQQGDWTPPYRLSAQGEEIRVKENEVVADRYGFAHAFWVESNLLDRLDSIQYTRFDGANWTQPNDVLAAPYGVGIDMLSAATDRQGQIHLAWTASGGFRDRPIFYSRAPAHDAFTAPDWLKPVRIDVPAHLIELRVDSTGVVHILYAVHWEPEPGIYHVRSDAGGLNWSKPVRLDPDIPSDFAPDSVSLEIDDSDGLHALWYYAARSGRLSDAVRYSRSADGGSTWSEPFTIDGNEPAFVRLRAPGPVMAVHGQTVHVVWAAADPSLDARNMDLNYRYHRLSRDGGETWELPVRIFGTLNGQARDDLTVDALGRVHFFGQIRFPQGVYHSYWDGVHWTNPSLAYLIRQDSDEDMGDHIHAHWLKAAIRGGNEAVITFYDNQPEEDGSFYGMHRILEGLEPAHPEPTPVAVTRQQPTPIPGPSETVGPAGPPPPSAKDAARFSGQEFPRSIDASALAGGVASGAGPALLLLVVVLGLRLLRRA